MQKQNLKVLIRRIYLEEEEHELLINVDIEKARLPRPRVQPAKAVPTRTPSRPSKPSAAAVRSYCLGVLRERLAELSTEWQTLQKNKTHAVDGFNAVYEPFSPLYGETNEGFLAELDAWANTHAATLLDAPSRQDLAREIRETRKEYRSISRSST